MFVLFSVVIVSYPMHTEVLALGGQVCDEKDKDGISSCSHVVALEMKRSETMFLAMLYRKPYVQIDVFSHVSFFHNS